MVKPGSYLDKLEQARIAKLNQNQQTNTITIPISKPVVKSVPQTAPQVTVTINKQEDNSKKFNLPFADEIYDHLKYVTTKLSSRVKGNTPLSFEELNKFKESVNAIIEDSYQDIRLTSASTQSIPQTNVIPTQSTQSTQTTQSKATKAQTDIKDKAYDQMTDEEKSTFANYFKGTSSWVIPGMDKMTTEEYYQAINKRIEDIKNIRKAEGTYDRQTSESYFESLNKKNRSK
mmetsp:Transcript_21041/g.19172  ORF Transcript_21041/g.19172 Transcript_21041/m.19172 type:complete len:231 (+) Transcript_21041:151-843(+)